MFDEKIGINPNLLKKELNQLLKGTVTRIKRCISVKEVALDKIREDNPESRAYGFKHINRIIEIQVGSYLRYIKSLRQFLGMMDQLRPSFDSLEPLEKGFFNQKRFNSIKGKIEANVIALEQKIPLIEEKANEIYGNVLSQKQLLSVQMTGKQEAQLRAKITLEIKESEELIKQLNECMSLSFKAIKNFSAFQVGFLNFLKKAKKTNGGNLIDDSEAFVERIQGTISFFYAFKTQILLVGLSIGFFSPSESVSAMGYSLAGGIVGIDGVMDFLASLPAQRKIAKNLPKLVRALNRRRESLTNQLIRVAQAVPMTRL